MGSEMNKSMAQNPNASSSSSSGGSGRMANKICIVTGGGSGFGAGIAAKFVKEGAKVIIAELNADAGAKVAKELGCESAQCNVAKKQDWEDLLKFTLEKYGGVDVVCNNAGYSYSKKSTLETTDADFDNCMNVNVRSLQYSVQVIIPQMRKQGRGGVFLQTSSTAAYRPRDQLAWYSASKAAVSNASKALAIEFAAEQIRFVCVNPVIGGTGMRHLFMGGLEDSAENRKAWEKTIPMGRFSTPEDIANACCYLGSDEAGFITGIDFFVDGGRTV